jgi:type II secretory pathway component PulM
MTATALRSHEPALKDAPASLMLMRAARELHDLAAMTDRLQNVVGDVVILDTEATNARVYELQDLDRLRQSISCLAVFIESVALDAGPEWIVDASRAIRQVTLLELAARLVHPDTEGRRLNSAPAGDCDLF